MTDKIAEVAALRNAATSSRDNVATPELDDVVHLERDRAATLERVDVGMSLEEPGQDDVPVFKPRRSPNILPHMSLYAHENVHYALKKHALGKRVKLQAVLRQALADYMEKHGIALDVETGKRIRNVKTL